MGDRAQIVIHDNGTVIYFYTHWRGTALPQLLAKGLKTGRARWADPGYLSRILFCTMIRPEELREETGYAISAHYQDSMPQTDLIVDMDNRRVQYLERNWTFQEYVELPVHSWDALS